jgi:hypothetical protein
MPVIIRFIMARRIWQLSSNADSKRSGWSLHKYVVKRERKSGTSYPYLHTFGYKATVISWIYTDIFRSVFILKCPFFYEMIIYSWQNKTANLFFFFLFWKFLDFSGLSILSAGNHWHREEKSLFCSQCLSLTSWMTLGRQGDLHF